MAAAHHADRAAKSEGVKIVKMNFSEKDLYAARIERLAEIKADLDKTLPANLVHLVDVASMLGLSETNKVTRRARKLKIKLYTARRENHPSHKMALCVTEEDAALLIRSYYE